MVAADGRGASSPGSWATGVSRFTQGKGCGLTRRGGFPITKQNFKPVYSIRNSDWRICYHANGRWKLQERCGLPEGTDRSKHQPWIDHNTNMDYEAALNRLITTPEEREM